MRIRFTLGDPRQVDSRYSCYLLGVMVGELDEHLKSLWRRASARDMHEMQIYALYATNISRDIASRYGSGGAHPAPDVAGLAHRIYAIAASIYDRFRAHRPGGELTEAEVQEIRKDMQKAGGLVEKLAGEATDSCGA
jgi:hypothetical protein